MSAPCGAVSYKDSGVGYAPKGLLTPESYKVRNFFLTNI